MSDDLERERIVNGLMPAYGTGLRALVGEAQSERVPAIYREAVRKAVDTVLSGYASAVTVEVNRETTHVEHGIIRVDVTMPRALAEELGLV